MPKGVRSRRSKEINSSIYWTRDISPQNVEQHISYMKKCGFTKAQIFFPAIFQSDVQYSGIGEYKINKNFPNGIEDLKEMLDRLKEEGIAPGLHILHTHIGFHTPYLTPSADSRINLTRFFTLAKPLLKTDDKIYVEENPCGAVMNEKCRVLNFGGELIHYDGYTTEWPYFFYGCKRGFNDTDVKECSKGTIGGILDISEYGAGSAYINQNTVLQDEIDGPPIVCQTANKKTVLPLSKRRYFSSALPKEKIKEIFENAILEQ